MNSISWRDCVSASRKVRRIPCCSFLAALITAITIRMQRTRQIEQLETRVKKGDYVSPRNGRNWTPSLRHYQDISAKREERSHYYKLGFPK